MKKRVLTFAFLAALCCAVSLFFGPKISAYLETDHLYRMAEKAIENGEYDRAADLMEPIRYSGYMDTTALVYLCQAHKYLNSGDVFSGWLQMQHAHFNFQTTEQMDAIEEFKEELQREYEAYEKEQAEERRKAQKAPKPAPVSSHNNSGSSGGKTSYGGITTDGFSHPDDFYDWYRDDFVDYEEAEDHYYEHGGW